MSEWPIWAALDTNVLAYAEGVGNPDRCDKVRSLVAQMPLESRFCCPRKRLASCTAC